MQSPARLLHGEALPGGPHPTPPCVPRTLTDITGLEQFLYNLHPGRQGGTVVLPGGKPRPGKLGCSRGEAAVAVRE